MSRGGPLETKISNSARSDLSKPWPQSYYGKPIQIDWEWDFFRRVPGAPNFVPWPPGVPRVTYWGPRVLKRKEFFFGFYTKSLLQASLSYTPHDPFGSFKLGNYVAKILNLKVLRTFIFEWETSHLPTNCVALWRTCCPCFDLLTP